MKKDGWKAKSKPKKAGMAIRILNKTTLQEKE